jgi:hypothetical protein
VKNELFYFNVTTRNIVRQFLKIEVWADKTVVSSPIDLLRQIHTTHHEPQVGIYPTSALHVREGRNTLIEVRHQSRSPLTVTLGSYFVDFSDDDSIQRLREFRKTAFEEAYAADLDALGRYLTVHLFQGKPNDLAQKLDQILKDESYDRYIAPRCNGFYINPPAPGSGHWLSLLYNDCATFTVGVLAFGMNKEDVDYSNLHPANTTKEFAGKYVAFAPGKRAVRP